jgi:hypothetical protein
MGSKRQMTMAKRAREEAVKLRRAQKQERKREAAAARKLDPPETTEPASDGDAPAPSE